MTEPNDEDRDLVTRMVKDNPNASDRDAFKAMCVLVAEVRAAERERGSLALAACEAREAKALAALDRVMRWLGAAEDNAAEQERCRLMATAALSAPRDSEALAAIVLKALMDGGKYVAETVCSGDHCACVAWRAEDLADPDDPATKRLVARILSGGAA